MRGDAVTLVLTRDFIAARMTSRAYVAAVGTELAAAGPYRKNLAAEPD